MCVCVCVCVYCLCPHYASREGEFNVWVSECVSVRLVPSVRCGLLGCVEGGLHCYDPVVCLFRRILSSPIDFHVCTGTPCKSFLFFSLCWHLLRRYLCYHHQSYSVYYARVRLCISFTSRMIGRPDSCHVPVCAAIMATVYLTASLLGGLSAMPTAPPSQLDLHLYC